MGYIDRLTKITMLLGAGLVMLAGCSATGDAGAKAAEAAAKASEAAANLAAAPKESAADTDKEGTAAAAGAYDGIWYAQDDSGAVLTIGGGTMTVEYSDYTSSAAFEPKEQDGYTRLSVPEAGDVPFWFYEVNFYGGEERIDAYTWPVDDGDGGYERTIFGRDEYEAGDTVMLSYLYGDWEIMDDGELIQEPGMKRDRLRFALPDYHRMSFIKADGERVSFDIELSDMFEDTKGTYDRLTLSNRGGGSRYGWDEVRPGQTFQIMIANNLGMDYMMLRELGDERTGFATDALRYDRSNMGIWMLRRPSPDDYDEDIPADDTMPSTRGVEDGIRLCGTSFHAIKWMEFGNSCTLQRVEIIPTTLDGEDAIGYILPDDEYAYSAINYEYSGKENMAHGGYFEPCLVNVTTDDKGQITQIAYLEPAGDGLYFDREVR